MERNTHTVPLLCCFALNKPSRLDSGASPSLAALAAAQGVCSLIIVGALKSATVSFKVQQKIT